MADLKKEDVVRRVKVFIAEHLCLSEAEVKDESELIEDLGADSLDLVELGMDIEEEFNIEINDDEAEKLKTVKDGIDYVCKALKIED